MAVSQQDIVARIRQIQETGGGDTAATRAQIAREAQKYGVGAGQIAGALQSIGGSQTEADVRSMAREAGAAFDPPQTGGMLGGVQMPSVPTAIQVSNLLQSGQIDRGTAQGMLQQSVALPSTVLPEAFTRFTGRELTEEQLNRRLGELESGAYTLNEALSKIPFSEEAMGIQYDSPVVQSMADLFEDILGRAPSQKEIGFGEQEFSRLYEDTGSAEQALQGIGGLIQSTPEFITNSVSSIYSNVFDRPADEATRTALTEQAQNLINSGVPVPQALEDIGELVTTNKRTEDLFNTIKSEDPSESVKGLRDLFYGSYVSGQPLGAGTVEELLGPQDVSQRFDPSLQDPFTRSLVAYVNAEGLFRLNEAIEQGDTETAQRLSRELEDPYSFYIQNVNGRDIAKNIRSDVVGADLFYGGRNPRGGFLQRELSSFGRSVGSFFENPIDAVDRWKDRPLNQFIVSLINPAAGALLSAYSTVDRGGKLSPIQLISLAANAPGIAELGQAGFTAAGGGEFGAGFLTEQSIMNAAQNFGVTSPDALQGIVQAGEKLNQAYNVLSDPVTSVANNIIGNLGGKEALIAAAGDGAATRIEEGLRSGATAALIAEATGENAAIAFVKELQGDIPIENFIPDVPESIKNFVAGVGDAISDIPLPDLEFIEEWVEENITLQVNTDLFDGIRGLGFTDKLSSIDDWIEDNVDLSALEDFLKDSGDAIGETVKELVEAVPEIDLPSMDLPDISLAGVVPMEELAGPAGPARTPSRGVQGLLPVDTTFYYEEPSLAEAMLTGQVG